MSVTVAGTIRAQGFYYSIDLPESVSNICLRLCATIKLVIPMRKVSWRHFYSLSLSMKTVTSFLPMNLLDKSDWRISQLEVLSLICALKTAPKCNRSHQGLG